MVNSPTNNTMPIAWFFWRLESNHIIMDAESTGTKKPPGSLKASLLISEPFDLRNLITAKETPKYTSNIDALEIMANC